MNLIAFDFDGVLIPDCERIPTLGGRDDFYKFTQFMRPMFQPKMDYCIITGRPYQYRTLTEDWCRLHLAKQPFKLFHSFKEDMNSFEYKADILNSNKYIKIFVESSAKSVEKMRSLTDCKVLHFSEYFNKVLTEDLLFLTVRQRHEEI